MNYKDMPSVRAAKLARELYSDRLHLGQEIPISQIQFRIKSAYMAGYRYGLKRGKEGKDAK